MAMKKKSKTATTKRPAKIASPKAKKAQPKKVSAQKSSPSKTTRATPPHALRKAVLSKAPKASPANAKKGAAAKKDLNKKTVNTAHANTHKAKADIKAASPSEQKRAHFSKSDLEQFKVDLMAMRDRITGQSGSMRNAALQRDDEVNPEEDGTDAFMRLQTLEQVSSQQQILANINEALRAIEKGSYGACDMCGELISKPRLAVLPFAKHCIKCQSEMERPGRSSHR